MTSPSTRSTTTRSHQFIDQLGGLADVADRVIRIIGEPAARYREDPVRMLRVVGLPRGSSLIWNAIPSRRSHRSAGYSETSLLHACLMSG